MSQTTTDNPKNINPNTLTQTNITGQKTDGP